ncbi:MAG: hypothetical protein EPN88_03600 [Bacteroidetes bacterium]|nr:MAG: hypothetical protein EPN88_03600 [Bacteroidota bacterium]
MKRLTFILFFVAVISTGLSFSQRSSNGFFNSQYVSGSVNFKGLYREQKSQIGIVNEDQKSTYYVGGIAFNTGSYLFTPDLIFINLDAEFNPETRRETYLLIPDRSEVRTLSKLDFRTSVFRNKSINLNTFINLNQTYFNRELLTNIKSDNKQWGGLLSLNNKFLPVSVSFRQSDWTQKEIQTGRTFRMKQNNLLGSVTKSFGNSDKHELLYSHDDFNYNYADSREIINIIDKVALNNNIYFDRGQRYSFNSQVSYFNQAGDNKYTRIDAIEKLMFYLPGNFRLMGGYNYYKLRDQFQTLSQNRIYGSLNQQLFESLSSNVSMEYSGISHTIYKENIIKAGFDLNYTKKIPTGNLNMSYRYYRGYFNMNGVSAPLKIINEEHILSDGKITLLNRPYVNLSTLQIKDKSGVIIYQLNFDYIVNLRNNFVEIQRILGGQITNDQVITADYTSIQPGSYNYETDNNSFSTGILLFKRLIELYYKGSFQDYRNMKETEFLILDHYSQNIYGTRIDIGFAGAGVEYDSYNSNIIPYKRYRYFMDLNWSFRSRLLVSLNGNIMDYKIIADDVNQKHSNISGKITYNINQKTKIDIDAGYLSQKGRNIDLKLITSKLALSTSFRQLYFHGGIEMYRRQYLNSNFSFFGTFVELLRKF